MGARLSVYAGEPLARLLDLAGGENRSARINDAAARYLAVVDHEINRLDFTRAEWRAICDALNGTLLADDGWRHIWADIADSPELDGKWGIDHTDLAERLRGLSAAARVAVAEVVERFWSRADLPTDDALRHAGAI